MKLLTNDLLSLNEQLLLKPFCKTDLFSLYINYVHQVTAFVWHKPTTSRQYKQGVLWLNEIVLTNSIKNILIDATQVGEVAQHNYDWTLQTFAKFQGTSFVKRVAQVLNENCQENISEPEIEACAASTAYQLEFTAEAFHATSDAERWLLRDKFYSVA